jgi:hypothetical protein
MKLTRRDLINVAVTPLLIRPARGANQADSASALSIAPGPFSAADASLERYSCPEWFRDAKFGIWAHWGPSSAIGDGDWYARNMYMEGSPQYQYHLKTYGHPVEIRLQGYDPALESRAIRSTGAHPALRASRREILRQHGRALRQLRPVELAPPLELGEYGPAPRHRRRVAGGREGRGSAFWNQL